MQPCPFSSTIGPRALQMPKRSCLFFFFCVCLFLIVIAQFLYHCFDDEGKFTRGAAAWLLLQAGVLRETKKGCDLSALFPPLSELELSRSRDNVLARSMDKAEVNQELFNFFLSVV